MNRRRKNFEFTNRGTYLGPNLYLDQQAICFELNVPHILPEIDILWKNIVDRFPGLGEEAAPETVAELVARTIIEVGKCRMNLFATKWTVIDDGGSDLIAIQYIDPETAQRSINFVRDWLNDLIRGRQFHFEERFARLQKKFCRSIFGGPTIYSLIEAGHKAGFPMYHLESENVFMWGMGRRQVRGRSTTVHLDSIKDTEFTTLKDRVKEFLEDLGFPTPRGGICNRLKDAIRIADDIGYPVVLKPVAGHKGEGVTTGVRSPEEVESAFRTALAASARRSDGIIVEKEVTGTDHRLLTVRGKFVAALQRVPAYVTGDGRSTIEELIRIENSRKIREDTPRSPLCKINVDDDMIDFLRLQTRSLRTVPEKSETVTLRRVANISAGGVSINVTDRIHPMNVKLAEDISKYLCVNVLGIDVLAKDISKPWTESPCNIIEINAAPGVFMHLAPAEGESIDVPGRIMGALFPLPGRSRIPTLVFNRLETAVAGKLTDILLEKAPGAEIGLANDEGVFFNGQFFCRRPHHISNIRNVVRNPRCDISILQYPSEVILREGMYHWGADLVVLDTADRVEAVLARDVLPNGTVITIDRERGVGEARTNGNITTSFPLEPNPESALMEVLRGLADPLLETYGLSSHRGDCCS